MIKLVATDVDGTLVKDSMPHVYPEMFDMVLKLKERGVIFAVASGRQYNSIRGMFEPVSNEMIFIAENGAHVVCRGYDMDVTVMDRAAAEELVRDLRTLPKGCEIVVSTSKGCYLESEDRDFLNMVENGYRNKIFLVEDVLKEKIDIIKVAVFRRHSIRDIGEEQLIPRWKGRVKAFMAGDEWVDFVDLSVDKGRAIGKIQQFFHILPEETMVFGDNGNDIPMFRMAKESYAVETARDDVKSEARHICRSYEEKGVYQVLKTLL